MTQLPEGLSDELFDANRQLSYLAERVTDEELREAITEVRSRAALLDARRVVENEIVTEVRLQADMMEITALAAVANERLGEVLRRLL
jgi:hypothetical protein